MKRLSPVLLFLLAGLMAGAAETNSLPPRVFPDPDRIRYDGHCLTVDGKDLFVYSGAFHYFRCPKQLWPERFEKIKEAGFNTVETYAAWNWSEPQMPAGTNDFSKVNVSDLDEWLTMAEEYGFYIIVRPGPYICAEWATGGFPEWLLTKMPEKPLRSEGWLRSDDPVFLAWSKHWYDAVCPVIARHQVTRRAPGQPGVILVQVENEYDYAKFSDEVKANHVKALAGFALADHIDVPLFTCWTHQVRGSSDPVLRQIFDCCNFYPRWNVEGEVRPAIEKLRAEQPDAPLATTELQGGWFSKVGGKLSEGQEGLTAAQIQNLTLYAMQKGDTILNYYMLFGGSNLGDWGARDMTTTYDYNAPIREWGGVGDRYQRVQAIGDMLREHGAGLARAEVVECDVAASQNDIAVVMRRAEDGSRYLFVRTSQRDEARQGTATVKEKSGDTNGWTFDYQLEPFGAMVLYVPAGATNAAQGQWLPKITPLVIRSNALPPVAITSAKMQTDPGPARWTKLKPGETLAQAGVYDSRFIFYRANLSSRNATNVTVELPKGDAVLITVDGKTVAGANQKSGGATLALPRGGRTVDLLYENRGYANGGKAMEQPGGITRVSAGPSDAAALQFGSATGFEKQWWDPAFNDKKWKTVSIGPDSAPATDLLTWYRMSFQLSSPVEGPEVPCRLHLEVDGNGFLYLNGHALGRYWQAGPQHDFYLPECWLNAGKDKTNVIVLNLRPLEKGAAIHAAAVEYY